jgi:hypothetical protein
MERVKAWWCYFFHRGWHYVTPLHHSYHVQCMRCARDWVEHD